MSYKAVHRLVHYNLKASPKVPRPVSRKQGEEKREEFKKSAWWMARFPRLIQPSKKHQKT